MKIFSRIFTFFLSIACVEMPCTGAVIAAYTSMSMNGKTTKLSSKISESQGSRRTFLTKSAVSSIAAAATTANSIGSGHEAWAVGKSGVPAVGTQAPEFELPSSRGEGKTTLNELVRKGKKWTVLYFYPGAFTSGCTLEARGFQRDIDKYRAIGAQIVGVSVDSPEKNAQFCTSEGLDFYMLSDKNGSISKKYGSALSIPGFGTFSNRQTYIIDASGILRWVFTDVEGHVARHSAEVLEKLDELAGNA